MISDVIFEAIEEIERYQREHPETYRDFAMQLDQLKHQMREVQRELDSPPPKPPFPRAATDT